MNAARPFPTMNKLAKTEGKLLVGLSGGADSVALLHLLLEAGCQIAAVHVNHGLRGAASDGDEAFVRALCEERGVPLTVFHACPPEHPSEGWAREVRYAFFRQAMADSGADALVLAHHRDDQAETLLLHLVRGAGLTGLTGMAAKSTLDGMTILRPLLPYGRAELRAYLEEKGASWREDASNAEPRYLRNALRLEVLPLMEQLAPGAVQRMAAAADLLREDEAALNALTADFLAAHPDRALPLDALMNKPLGLQRRILRAWWAMHAPVLHERSLDARQTEGLLALLTSPVSAKCNLPGNWHGQRGWTHLHLVSPERENIPEQPAAASALLEVLPYTGDRCDGCTSQVIPSRWLAACTVRSRRPGDFIRPFGSDGSQSMQDYFTNRHVDAAFRDRVPLLCRGSEVLLAGGVGAGSVPRTEKIDDPVLLRWKESFPWQRSTK